MATLTISQRARNSTRVALSKFVTANEVKMADQAFAAESQQFVNRLQAAKYVKESESQIEICE